MAKSALVEETSLWGWCYEEESALRAILSVTPNVLVSPGLLVLTFLGWDTDWMGALSLAEMAGLYILPAMITAPIPGVIGAAIFSRNGWLLGMGMVALLALVGLAAYLIFVGMLLFCIT
jgi:hypothetical protein